MSTSMARPTPGWKSGHAQSCSISTNWHVVYTVRVTFAIDAKDCDISVGAIGTKHDAYLYRPTAATLAPERRRRKKVVTFGMADVKS